MKTWRFLSFSAEFNLTFRTSKPNGVIFYIEGQYAKKAPYDFESLYIMDGKLNYLVFNPEPTGIGSSFGSHVMTDFDVNTNEDIQVSLSYNIIQEALGPYRSPEKHAVPINKHICAKL